MSEPTEREWLEGLRYEDKFPEAGDGGRVPDVNEQRETMAERMKHGPRAQQERMAKAESSRQEPADTAQRIGAYLEQHPPWGFRDRWSASGWAAIAQAVLDAPVLADPASKEGGDA